MTDLTLIGLLSLAIAQISLSVLYLSLHRETTTDNAAHADHCGRCGDELVCEEDVGHIRLNDQALCVACADVVIDEAFAS